LILSRGRCSSHVCAESREVERMILDDEEIICCYPGMARESVVLEPYVGVGVPVVPWHVGRSVKAQRELCIADALT
jgi:hypothetical protein